MAIELPEFLFGAGSLGICGVALKTWLDTQTNKKDTAIAMQLAEQNAADLKAHQKECTENNLRHARVEERVASIQANQAFVIETMSSMDSKMDRILELRK